jgi:hypothetical protein
MLPRTASSLAPASESESMAGVRFTISITRTSDARATATVQLVDRSMYMFSGVSSVSDQLN